MNFFTEAQRRTLIENSHYLGAADIRNEVIWKKSGQENTLVAKDSVAAEDKHATESDSDGKKEDDNSDGSTVDSEPESDPTTFLTPAPLVFIAQISPESCFLMPDGNWKGPTEYAQSFTDVKLNCLAVWFMAQTETGRIFQTRDLQCQRNTETVDQTASRPIPAEEDIESIENWPINNENARKAAAELKKNHRIIPLPAYDIHGNLIHPTQYRDNPERQCKRERHLHRGHREPAHLGGCPEIWAVLLKPPEKLHKRTREARPRNNAASETKARAVPPRAALSSLESWHIYSESKHVIVWTSPGAMASNQLRIRPHVQLMFSHTHAELRSPLKAFKSTAVGICLARVSGLTPHMLPSAGVMEDDEAEEEEVRALSVHSEEADLGLDDATTSIAGLRALAEEDEDNDSNAEL
ncbi:hypothetical protein B0H14DRAFT_2632606 [Mycena olivaceomarginata]|nr:hypothetical protein B0H14DRAFT_2632606 [Mycena olivaceomarginata]